VLAFALVYLVATGIGIGAIGIMAKDVAVAAGVYDPGCRCSKPQVVRQHAPRPVVRHAPRPTYDGRGHQTNWMQQQGFRTCSQVLRSCYRGVNKTGHGMAYGGVCEDRFQTCRQTGCWHTNNTGSVCGLAQR
jgi:hypothetical protein